MQADNNFTRYIRNEKENYWQTKDLKGNPWRCHQPVYKLHDLEAAIEKEMTVFDC